MTGKADPKTDQAISLDLKKDGFQTLGAITTKIASARARSSQNNNFRQRNDQKHPLKRYTLTREFNSDFATNSHSSTAIGKLIQSQRQELSREKLSNEINISKELSLPSKDELKSHPSKNFRKIKKSPRKFVLPEKQLLKSSSKDLVWTKPSQRSQDIFQSANASSKRNLRKSQDKKHSKLSLNSPSMNCLTAYDAQPHHYQTFYNFVKKKVPNDSGFKMKLTKQLLTKN